MIYPTERDIEDFMARLPREIKDQFQPVVEDAQREYRRARLKDPADEKTLIEILFQHAITVFKSLAAKRLNARSGDFDAFRSAISMEGGDAEMAMWFAHDLYRVAGDGRMLAIWHRAIVPKLRDLVRQAEDAWWIPGFVPEGWGEFLAQPSNHGEARIPRGEPGRESDESGRVLPAEEVNPAWEHLEILFISDERVQLTIGERTETRNYAEMGFGDARNGKPNKAWGMLRTMAENRGVLANSRTAGAPWPQVEKRMQEIRQLLQRVHAAPGDPLPLVKGAGYQARFKIRCSRSYST